MTELLVAGLVGMLGGLVGLSAYYAATEQNRLSAASVAADWLRDVRSWASEAVDVLAEAGYTCRSGGRASTADEQICLRRCRHELSALIDRGRFLLPNERENEYGVNKPTAYQGLRHPALDALVAAERLLETDTDPTPFPDGKSALIEVRREFVSTVQAILGPRSVNKQVAMILRRAHEDRKRDLSLGGLLPDPNIIPSGAEALLDTAYQRFQQRSARRRS